MRFSVSLLALVLANPALAEDVLVRADVAEATVYAGVAEVLRRVDLDLPAGQHRVILPTEIVGNAGFPPLVTADGALVGTVEGLTDFAIPEGALDTEAQAEARRGLEDAIAAYEATRTEIEAAQGAVRAAELQQAYLLAIVSGGGDGVAMPDDAAALAAILATLGSEMTRADLALHTARQDVQALQQILETRADAVEDAERVLNDLQPIAAVSDMWAVELELSDPGPVSLEVVEATRATWQPAYDLHLDSETSRLEVERHVNLMVLDGLPWTDVAVTLSTADPRRAIGPSGVWPMPARIFEPLPAASLRTMGAMAEMAMDAEAPMAEPMLIVEDRAEQLIIDGLSISYGLADPVTVGPDGTVFLPLGGLVFEADLVNRAVPRRDATAFLIADIENTSSEPILPGEARFFRDNALIGQGYLELLPEGGEVELPFGPLDHIQLSWTDLSRDTGDRGVFVSSDTEERQVVVTAQNLSGDAVELELIYATPFSEQEDLEVEVTVDVLPLTQTWEDLRGVYAWDLQLAAGSQTSIQLGFAFSWPDGQELDWRP